MIMYLDTSALVKKYFNEEGSTEIISLWKKATGIVTSSVAYAETLATVGRKKREAGIGKKLLESIIASFQKDWNSFIRVDVNNDLNETIIRLTFTHSLRGFDAIHLASALIVHEKIREDYLFVCFDKRMVKAAKEEGLEIFPEVQNP